MNANTRSKLLAALLAVAAMSPAVIPATSRADDAAKPAENLPAAKALLEKYVEATGGRAAYEKHTTRKLTGKLSLPAQNISGTMTAIMSAPDKARISQTLTGIGTIEQGFDGETLWEMSPMSGVRIIDGAERDGMLPELTFNAELQGEKLYKSCETIGVTDVDGKPAYDVKLVSKVGDKESHVFYDKESGLLVRRDATLASPAGEMKSTTTFTDYKDFDGIKFPGLSTTSVANTTFTVTTDSVEHDQPVPAGTFDLPDDVKKMKAKMPAATMPAK